MKKFKKEKKSREKSLLSIESEQRIFCTAVQKPKLVHLAVKYEIERTLEKVNNIEYPRRNFLTIRDTLLSEHEMIRSQHGMSLLSKVQ